MASFTPSLLRCFSKQRVWPFVVVHFGRKRGHFRPLFDTPEKADRNAEIIARYEQGETVSELATAFEISEQRVSQIIHGRRN